MLSRALKNLDFFIVLLFQGYCYITSPSSRVIFVPAMAISQYWVNWWKKLKIANFGLIRVVLLTEQNRTYLYLHSESEICMHCLLVLLLLLVVVVVLSTYTSFRYDFDKTDQSKSTSVNSTHQVQLLRADDKYWTNSITLWWFSSRAGLSLAVCSGFSVKHLTWVSDNQ